jgi:hypothetical protein
MIKSPSAQASSATVDASGRHLKVMAGYSRKAGPGRNFGADIVFMAEAKGAPTRAGDNPRRSKRGSPAPAFQPRQAEMM